MHVVDDRVDSPLWSRYAIRLQIVLLLCFMIAMQGLLRGSFGMAIVCFVDDSTSLLPPLDLNATNQELLVIINDDNQATCRDESAKDAFKGVVFRKPLSEYTVSWSAADQSQIHSAFAIGSFLSVLFVDRAIQKLGPKRTALIGTALSVIGTFLTPLVIINVPSTFIIMAVRFLMGIGYSLTIPVGDTLISRWFPSKERSTAVALFTTGNQIGLVFAMLLTSRLCEVSFLGGWPLAFVLYGVIGIGFMCLWYWRVTDKPREHYSVTAVELEHITGHTGTKARSASIIHQTPYKKILLSLSVLALCACSFAQTFVFFGIDTYLPKYYQQALKVDLSSNGFFSAVPFFLMIFTKMSFALLADNLKGRKVSQNLIMKCFNGLACFGGAICIILISFMGCGSTVPIFLLMSLTMGLFAGFVPGYNTGIVIVAPLYTGTIAAYCMIYAQVGAALVPVIIGFLTPNGTVDEWKWVFYVLAAILTVVGAFFQIFGTAHPEPWGEAMAVHSSTAQRKIKDEAVPLATVQTSPA